MAFKMCLKAFEFLQGERWPDLQAHSRGFKSSHLSWAAHQPLRHSETQPWGNMELQTLLVGLCIMDPSSTKPSSSSKLVTAGVHLLHAGGTWVLKRVGRAGSPQSPWRLGCCMCSGNSRGDFKSEFLFEFWLLNKQAKPVQSPSLILAFTSQDSLYH